ncbi:exo-alpha-sialidase [Ectothiorhodospiraceae bacterium BW-2]|nr:exo-alpha-sialidase [Ectothiorhodospiraceae bacterium BW-2]
MKLSTGHKMWDQGEHNAFTDLIRFKHQWYCCFREGGEHVCNHGKLRLLRSDDFKKWQSIALLSDSRGDLRDPKLSVTHHDELMLNGVIRFIEPVDGEGMQSLSWLSTDGVNWSGSFSCATGLGSWRWSTTWQQNYGYSVAYSGKDSHGCLYRTEDGKSWQIVKEHFFPEADIYSNETSLLFLNDQRVLCLLRRDSRDPDETVACLGEASPPYTTWQWQKLDRRIGGPKMIQLKSGELIAVIRLYDERVRTSVCQIDSGTGHVIELLALPSGGDCSYAGVVEYQQQLYISYYSSHEEDKSAIYSAVVTL